MTATGRVKERVIIEIHVRIGPLLEPFYFVQKLTNYPTGFIEIIFAKPFLTKIRN